MSQDAQPQPEQLEAVRAAVGSQYSVERLLGQGGMGAVYLGRDVTLHRPVAIKVISADVAASQPLRDRFLQEARAVARLRHPNIVSVYTAGESNGLLYFAMELVPGESLRELLTREGRLPNERAQRIIAEIALALDHAHANGLVHRDVKPDNILIDGESGRALLTDFGVARVTEDEGGLTQTGMILGSPRYMSPEQVMGEKTIDGRSDLYSLALVGYELYTGSPVVEATSITAMIYKHLNETPPPLAGAVPGVPVHVSEAIARGLAKAPADRWQSGREFAEAIAGAPISPSGAIRSPASAEQSKKIRRRALIGAGIVAAAAAVVAAGMMARGADDSADDGYLVTPFEIQSGDPSVAWLRQGSVNMLTLTLGQWSDLRVIDYERTLSLLEAEKLADKALLSARDAFTLARRADAGTVVMGQVQTTRDSLIVVAKLYDVSSEKSEKQAQEGMAIGGDPRPLFDRLAQQLLNIEGGGRTSTMQLAQATTSSLAAYRAYLEGVRLLNSWRLPEADREFARAIELDSTFALAYHKRSLGLGYAEAGGPAYVSSVDRAFELASRLPPRERALVVGHYHLAHALMAQGRQDTAAARQGFDASIKSYTDLMRPPRGDSLVAEGWYGLADAYFHARTVGQPAGELLRSITESLRGFSRTLAIDSTYHLAYSHLIQLYNSAASVGSGLLIAGDSAIMLDSATAARLGPAGITALQVSARNRGIEIARAWARADAGSMQPFVQLAQSYTAAGRTDSAVAVLRRALRSGPRSGAAIARTTLLLYEEMADDSGAAATRAYILDRFTPDSMRQINSGPRFMAHGTLMTSAAMSGRSADLDRAAQLFAATDPNIPLASQPSAPMVEYFRTALAVAMGDSLTAARRRTLARGTAVIDSLAPQVRQEARPGSASIPYLAFLLTHDTTFKMTAQRWRGVPLPELDAMVALDRRDTATALRLAEAFPVPDSLRNASFSFGGMRTAARAEVLERLGLLRQAAETYDAIALKRINRIGAFVEPGLPMWVRTRLASARLWAQLGERDRAIAAYEEFIRRWRDADGASRELVEQAKIELAAVRDAPAATGIIPPR